MAIVKTILKKTRTEAVVKLVGLGTIQITLAELAMGDETVNAPVVDIRDVFLSSQPTLETKITRNGVDVFQLFGNITDSAGVFKDNQNDTFAIDITTAGNTTLIVTLRKQSGYAGPGRSTYLTGGA